MIDCLLFLAEWTGLEPATPGVTGPGDEVSIHAGVRPVCRSKKCRFPANSGPGLARLIPKFARLTGTPEPATRRKTDLDPGTPSSFATGLLLRSSTAAGVLSNGREISTLRNIRRHEKLIAVTASRRPPSPRTAALDHYFDCESQLVSSRIRRLLPADEIRDPIGSDRPSAASRNLAATGSNAAVAAGGRQPA